MKLTRPTGIGCMAEAERIIRKGGRIKYAGSKPKPLAEWLTEIGDKAAKYEPPQ